MDQSNERHFDYIEEAHVTMSPQFHNEFVSRQELESTIEDVIVSIAALDRLKKTLFYGRDGVAHNGPAWQVPYLIPGNEQASINLLHCVIGLATEAGELLEGITEQLFDTGEAVDRVNMVEEVGDGLWYMAGILKASGFTFGEAQHRNIAKLRRRFPDKFKEHDANNRDLFAERAELEGGCGCPCEPAGSDGLRCPDANGKLLCGD